MTPRDAIRHLELILNLRRPHQRKNEEDLGGSSKEEDKKRKADWSGDIEEQKDARRELLLDRQEAGIHCLGESDDVEERSVQEWLHRLPEATFDPISLPDSTEDLAAAHNREEEGDDTTDSLVASSAPRSQ